MTNPPPTETLLSDFIPTQDSFPNLDEVIASFHNEPFQHLSHPKKFKTINLTLCQLILDAPPHAFLLTAVLDYLHRVNESGVIADSLSLSTFEFWLNRFSHLSEEENYLVRAKIGGKLIPRAEYQAYFPIGMDKIYPGSHFVAAHLSPDVDTMVASFWGWMDAFCARIGAGLHFWSLPGGPPDSPFTNIFQEMLGKQVFNLAARQQKTLSLTAMDIVSQKKLKKELGKVLTSEITHDTDTAVMLINEQGHYLGDWRDSDIEMVRQIIILFKSCLHWFENNLHNELINLFAQPDLSIKDVPAFYKAIVDVKIRDCEPAREFNEKQKADLDDFFRKILGIPEGLNGTFRDLGKALKNHGLPAVAQFQIMLEGLPQSELFGKNGKLIENRPLIFSQFKKIISHLDHAIYNVRDYVERLDVVIKIKHIVLGIPPLYITLRSDVEEMIQKMHNVDFLTLVIPEPDGSLYPVGVVRANDLRMNMLGTVSLRDFCNSEEIKMASYLEVISVVDHHKSSLKTMMVPSAFIGDAQSCNVLLAELAFKINDKYSLGGLTPEAIEAQIGEISTPSIESNQTRILQSLLKRRLVTQNSSGYFVNPKREFDEYFSFLHAILDDTDLLTKVSHRDIQCVASLLNRMKSIAEGREIEIIHFDDIPKDKQFVKKAAQRILQQADMYSIYKKIYNFRELEVERNLNLCAHHLPSNIFLDTKEQNGCTRVGQTKLFASNFPLFLKNTRQIRQNWLNKATEVLSLHPEIDLHLHMISTIASADEVYSNQTDRHTHKDELWVWIAPTQQAFDHLIGFFSSFLPTIQGIKESLSFEFSGDHAQEHAHHFTTRFPLSEQIRVKESHDGAPFMILRYKAGALNSRKTMISPYLPRMV